MLYQVLIEASYRCGNKVESKEFYELDKEDKRDIINEIIIPYLKNQEFQFNGYFLKKESINRILIKTTEKSVKVLSKYENDNMPTGLIMYVSPESILEYDEYTKDVTKEIFREANEMIDNSKKEESYENGTNKKDIFIVHGRDNEAKIEVARFVEKIGYNPIILHEKATLGKTIIEKIEEYSKVGFAIVLYTPCDEGGLVGEDLLKPRARQNVVFEHGYLIGRIGRKNVCALVKGEVEKPNDISGVVYIDMDGNGGWKLSIVKEMVAAGYEVDLSKLL
ncbi:TIR domain-containing protein [Clostridium paraputrificum]|uniref:TIR domain-containing protein n=1 Tax=Clostridium paraputrificum TaxID=29363 RepID=UPI00189C64E2|nr:nucleotide-binding protein [Clostridium paraputrificum]MDB2092528.1 nucleotide-binding protein [Clostridium paraputrificum]